MTRANMTKGITDRRAADRATYMRRAAKVRPEQTIREALGHEKSGLPERSMTTILEDHGVVTIEGLSGSEVRRTARYSSLVGKLNDEEISQCTFRQTVRKWAPFRGGRFLADPEAVIAILKERRQSEPEPPWQRPEPRRT